MNQQAMRQAARRSALDAQAVRRKERADRERRLEGLAVAVLTALGERDLTWATFSGLPPMNVVLARCFAIARVGNCALAAGRGGWLRGVCADGADLFGGGRCPGGVEVPSRVTDIEHLGSAHTDAEVEMLKAVAAQRIAAGQDELPIGVPAKQRAVSFEITSSRMGRLLDVLGSAYRQLGFDEACRGGAVFEQLVTARIIEPTSKQDAARVLAEAGVRALSYRTVKRRLPGYARQEWRDRLSEACAAAPRSDPPPWCFYDVTSSPG
jgi:hypothetical protein